MQKALIGIGNCGSEFELSSSWEQETSLAIERRRRGLEMVIRRNALNYLLITIVNSLNYYRRQIIAVVMDK
jgi:hypothetical protein